MEEVGGKGGWVEKKDMRSLFEFYSFESLATKLACPLLNLLPLLLNIASVWYGIMTVVYS